MTLKTSSLSEKILGVIKDKGTERPFSGEYDDFGETGTYLCRQCGLALFRSSTKFHSGCGWPSFDEAITKSIVCEKDRDGSRDEILCSRCSAHLGHVFTGEHFTSKNARYCINSVCLDFIADKQVEDTEEALYAAGCFWGVEHLLKQLPGVLKTEAGYTGGHKKYPLYQEVCSGMTGHYEAVRVIFDPSKISYEKLTRYFFEIHDPTQTNGQGPDHGPQYLSALFYYDDKQKETALNILNDLNQLGYKTTTALLPVQVFWPAEVYHQDYYEKTGKQPYCHRYEKKFK